MLGEGSVAGFFTKIVFSVRKFVYSFKKTSLFVCVVDRGVASVIY